MLEISEVYGVGQGRMRGGDRATPVACRCGAYISSERRHLNTAETMRNCIS
jgi:hypothetical protein